jgi:hypothetical protein
MRKLTALSLALLLPAAAVLASETPVDESIASQIRAVLTAEGYEVTEIEAEDGIFEAEALKDGMEYEIVLNDALEIVSAEQDDD